MNAAVLREAVRDEVDGQLDTERVRWQYELDRQRAEMRQLVEGAVSPDDMNALEERLRRELHERADALRAEAKQAVDAAVRQSLEAIRREGAEARTGAAGGDDEALAERVDELLARRLDDLGDSEVFREQLVRSLSDHGIPVLKNALDDWVRQRAARAATVAVQEAVDRAAETVLQESLEGVRETVAEEVRLAHRRTRNAMATGGAILAVGVLAAIALAL